MIAIKPIDILLPRNADLNKWAVVACDQFTSQEDYWKSLDSLVGDGQSTLRLIYPEVYLGEENGDARISDIHTQMARYLRDGVFEKYKNTFILVKRQTPFGNVRWGIVVGLDLDCYCFTHPSHAQVRSTEDVVMDRIPPRLKIRRGAPLELPHVIILIDDGKKCVIEKLRENANDVVYDFDLNMGGGHVTGYRVNADEAVALFENYAADKLSQGKDFLFAVGDGNHSLASAQAYWNEIKPTLTEEQRKTHPARFALCEVENLYDDGIKFEPIHRFVFGADRRLIDMLAEKVGGDATVNAYLGGEKIALGVPQNSAEAISAVQAVVEEFVKNNVGCKADYIHGEDNLLSVASQNSGVAIVMPPMRKEELFSYVEAHGALCKKTFSMGEAQEKRYYIEAKRI